MDHRGRSRFRPDRRGAHGQDRRSSRAGSRTPAAHPEKGRLERTCEQRIEEKAALEQQTGVIERITDTIGALRGAKETENDADTDAAEATETPPDSEARTEGDTQTTDTERNQPNERDTTADEYDQWEDLDTAIAAYEQRNALKTDVETLIDERAGLDDAIDSLEQQSSGLFGRISEAVTQLTNDKQQVEIRRERFNDTETSLTADGDSAASTTESKNAVDSSSRLGADSAEASETRKQGRTTENTETTTGKDTNSKKERPDTGQKRDFSL